MINICLYELIHPILIVKAQTGLVYYNQIGGCQCLQAEQEGYLLPIPLFDFNFDVEQFSIETSDEFDAYMSKRGFESIRIDRNMLKECQEAWIHVEIIDDCLLHDIKPPVKAILTWENSD